LTVAETCEYQGLDFLDFLRSEEIDVETFRRRRRRPRKRQVEGSPRRVPRQGSSAVESAEPISDKGIDFLGDAVAKPER
jgi:hypothetical protein